MTPRSGWLDSVIPPRGTGGALSAAYGRDTGIERDESEHLHELVTALRTNISDVWHGTTGELAQALGLADRYRPGVLGMLISTHRRGLRRYGWKLTDNGRNVKPRWTVTPPSTHADASDNAPDDAA